MECRGCKWDLIEVKREKRLGDRGFPRHYETSSNRCPARHRCPLSNALREEYIREYQRKYGGGGGARFPPLVTGAQEGGVWPGLVRGLYKGLA